MCVIKSCVYVCDVYIYVTVYSKQFVCTYTRMYFTHNIYKLYMYIYIYIYICIYIYNYRYMYVCIYIHIHKFICIYIYNMYMLHIYTIYTHHQAIYPRYGGEGKTRRCQRGALKNASTHTYMPIYCSDTLTIHTVHVTGQA
jgi:hypothetical protein